MSQIGQPGSEVQILPMRREHARQVARLHIEGIRMGFISSLGENFVTALYEGFCESPESFGYVAVKDGKVIGFASFTTNLNKLYRTVIWKRGFRFFSLLVQEHLSWTVFRKVLETLIYPKRIEKHKIPKAEFLSMAVAPEARGHGLATRFVQMGFEECRRRGVRELKILAAEVIGPINKMYEKFGFPKVTQIQNYGITSNVYVASSRHFEKENPSPLRIRPMRIEDVRQVAEIHRICFPPTRSLFSVLHPRVAWHLYAQYVEEACSMGMVLEEVKTGLIGGYAAGTLRPGFHKRFFWTHLPMLAWYLLIGLFTKRVVWKMVFLFLKANNPFRSRPSPSVSAGPAPAGLVACFQPVALHPDFRGNGHADRLVCGLMEHMFALGAVRVWGKIASDNVASRKLFIERIGWKSVLVDNSWYFVWADKQDYLARIAGVAESSSGTKRVRLPDYPPAFVTYGWCRSSYTVLWSLGQKGIPVHVGDASSLAMSRFSRYTRSFTRLPDFFSEPQAYIEALLDALKKTGAGVLLPCHEDTGLVSRYRDRFPEHIRTAVPTWETYQLAEDKLKVVEYIRRYNGMAPQVYPVQSRQQLEELSQTLTFPLVLKTRSGNSAKGVAIVRNREELKKKFESFLHTFHLPENRWPFLQEFLPGRVVGICALYNQGQCLAWFGEEYLRCKEFGRFGTSTLRRTWEDEAVIQKALSILEALRWHGLVHLDLIEDSEGNFKIIEINPRPWGAIALSVFAGVDFPWLWYQLSIGNPVCAEPLVRRQISCRWILGDYLALLNRLQHRRWKEAAEILRFQPGCYHDSWLSGDHLPFFMQYLDYAKKFVASGFQMNPTGKQMVH